MSLYLALALTASLAGNFLLWRLYQAAREAATGEARAAVLEAIQTHHDEVRDVAEKQTQVDSDDRGGAAGVLGRLPNSPTS